MFTSPALLTAATLLFLSHTIYALPAATPESIRPAALQLRPEPTDAWISVDKSGKPTSVTPVVTVSDGVATTISAIPPELTATELTRTDYGELTVSTGTAPALPTAENGKGKGFFLACSSVDVEDAPFCEPSAGSDLYPGTTYYVTWDSSVVNATKVTVKGIYINATTGETGDEVFTSDVIKTKWSYYAWKPNKGYLSHGTGQGVNISLTLNALSADDDDEVTHTYTGPTVLVTKAPAYQQPAPTVPSGAALYIALPTVFGFCMVMIFGVCLWNRKTRKIGLGNVMSRSRHEYGRAKNRAKRITTSMKGGPGGARKKRVEANIRLMKNLPQDQIYRDEPAAKQVDGRRDYQYDGDEQEVKMAGNGSSRGHVRRDSEGLGSLAGSPTSEHFPRQQNGNVFREEMERQQRHD